MYIENTWPSFATKYYNNLIRPVAKQIFQKYVYEQI